MVSRCLVLVSAHRQFPQLRRRGASLGWQRHRFTPSASSSYPAPIAARPPLLWGRNSHSYNYPSIKNNSRYVPRRSITSFLFGRAKNAKPKFRRPWHDPQFMQESAPEETEQWLLSLIQSARRDAEQKRIRCSDASTNVPVVYFDDNYELDALAYLKVAQSYAQSKRGSAPQKAEYWIGKLERHYEAAKELFRGTYRGHADGEEDVDASSEGDAREESPYAALTRPEKIRPKTTQPSTQSPATGDRNTQRAKAAAIVRNLQPTIDCYNALIEAWGHDKDPISVVRSRRWLTKLEEEAKNSNNGSILRLPLGPNARSYDLYLQSCSRGIGRHAKLMKERAEEAEKLLGYRLSPGAPVCVRPTTESFNYVLRAWTRCRKELGVAGKAMDLVLRMERIQKEHLLAMEKGLAVDEGEAWKQHVSPNTKTYTMAMDGWILKAGLKAEKWRGQEMARRNKIKQRAASGRGGNEWPQNSELDAGSDGQDDGTKEMEKAATILQYIHDLDRVGLADVHATVIAYNTLLSGWARLANEVRPDIPLKAEKLLHEMISLAEAGNGNAAPDVVTLNTIIKAWGRTKQPNSADRCEYWLRRMISESKSGERSFMVPPNVQTYNVVMDAHLQLGDPARVQDMLLEMDASEDVTPNSESFSKVIRAWLQDELQNSQYGLPGSSVENAWGWLEELLHREQKGDVDLGPAPDLFQSTIKTAARSSACGENMLTVGSLALRAMKSSRFAPDHLVYVWLLEIGMKVLPSLAVEKREETITAIFRQCCDDGLLSKKWLKTLCRSPSSEEGPGLSSEEPPQWGRAGTSSV
ncbi:hypothetical protein ACHAXT_002881 [Thalassiosira profunda]